MSRIGLICLLVGLSPALFLAGCGDSGGGRVSRGRFNPGKKDQETASRSGSKPSPQGRKSQPVSAGLDDLSPEGSMQRDLAKLRERERTQAKTVDEMRSAMNQAEDMVMKEERKLEEIRTQIARYDRAMQGYEQASGNGRSPRGREAPARAEYASAAPSDNQWANPYAGASNAGGEEVLYSNRSAVPMNPAPAQAPRNLAVADRGGNEYAEKPFAGATVTRSRAPSQIQAQAPATPAPAPAPRPQTQARHADEEESIWNPPSRLYADKAVQPKPVPTQQSVRPANPVAQPQAAARAPAPAAAPQPAKQAAPQMSVSGATFEDTEVFTPDLYLSGGKR